MKSRNGHNVSRSRWAALGAAVAITAGSVGVGSASIGSGERPVFVPIEPCRMLDTRPGSLPNDVTGAIGPNQALTFDVDGSVGECPSFPEATGLALNATAVAPTAAGYLSLVPGVLKPPAEGYSASSNLNFVAGAPPTPNAVELDLDGEQRFSVYNSAGSVHVVIDVVGYFEDHHHDDRYHTRDEVADLVADLASDIAGLSTEVDGKVESDEVYSKQAADARFETTPTSPIRINLTDVGHVDPLHSDVVTGSEVDLSAFPGWTTGLNLAKRRDGYSCAWYPIEIPAGVTVTEVTALFTTGPDVATVTGFIAQLTPYVGFDPSTDDPADVGAILWGNEVALPANRTQMTHLGIPHDATVSPSPQQPAASNPASSSLMLCSSEQVSFHQLDVWFEG